MKIISVIIITIGFVICAISSLGIRYSVYNIVSGLMNTETTGIGQLASALSNASLLSYVNIFGCVVIFIGLVQNFISMFTEKKRQAI